MRRAWSKPAVRVLRLRNNMALIYALFARIATPERTYEPPRRTVKVWRSHNSRHDSPTVALVNGLVAAAEVKHLDTLEARRFSALDAHRRNAWTTLAWWQSHLPRSLFALPYGSKCYTTRRTPLFKIAHIAECLAHYANPKLTR
jgi:hypothetical protein